MRKQNTHQGYVRRRLERLLFRSDLRQHPLRGIYRRIAWRLRWSMSSRPWLVRRSGAPPLLLPHGGAAAVIYFQGASEPELASFIRGFLKPGMVFADVGAHLGEYTVLAGAAVGASGFVHAFEARPDTFDILTRNIEMNGLRNVAAKSLAVWDSDGFCEFESTPDPSVSAVRLNHNSKRGGSLVRVGAITLDSYFAEPGVIKPALVKIDVEGAELHVLRGAATLLTASPSPMIVIEYGPRNAASFGYKADEMCEFLRQLGFKLYQFGDGRLIEVGDQPTLPEGADTCNIVAAKSPLPTSGMQSVTPAFGTA